MAMVHRVRQGEHLAAIAACHGHRDVGAIWEHPENARLRELRETPHVLLPGDRVFVPDPRPRSEGASTEARHRFTAKRNRLLLRLDVSDLLGDPAAGGPCRLVVGPEVHELAPDADGILEVEIPPTARDAWLEIADLRIPIRIGHLDPVEEPSGQRARLRNLGYLDESEDEESEATLRAAVTRFQQDHDLPAAGRCDEATRRALVDVHGC